MLCNRLSEIEDGKQCFSLPVVTDLAVQLLVGARISITERDLIKGSPEVNLGHLDVKLGQNKKML